MKPKTNIIYLAFAAVALAIGAVTANGAPGDIYVTDQGGAKVYKFTPGGEGSTFANLDVQPLGLAFDSVGNLFVACANCDGQPPGCIIKIDPSGVQSRFASAIGNYPNALAFDSSGNLFVADPSDGTILEYTPDGVGSTFATVLGAKGLAFDRVGNLFVSAGVVTGNGAIYKYTPDGVQSIFSNPGTLCDPWGLAFDTLGNLFVADRCGVIDEYTPGGVQSTFAVVSNSDGPIGIAFDASGNLFEGDYGVRPGNGHVYEFSPGGIQSTFASGGDSISLRSLLLNCHHRHPLRRQPLQLQPLRLQLLVLLLQQPQHPPQQQLPRPHSHRHLRQRLLPLLHQQRGARLGSRLRLTATGTMPATGPQVGRPMGRRTRQRSASQT